MTFTPRRRLLQQLAAKGLEFDQKLMRALQVSASRPDLRPEDSGFPDSYLTLALYRLNSVITHLVELDESRFNLFHEYKLAPPCSPGEVRPGRRLCSVLEKAAELASPQKTIGTGHFLRAVVSLTLDAEPVPAYGFPGSVIHNTFSAETLLWGLGHSAWTAVESAPELRTILSALDRRPPIEDTSYLLTTEGKRLVFRPTSELGTFPTLSGRAADSKQVALLTHFREQYGSVTPAELLELEDLINSSRTRELDLQRFFERCPHFLRMWDFREVHPQVYLTRDEDGPLVPDFILVDPVLSRATIVDLKLPTAKTVVKKHNRERFSTLVQEAIAQLQEYGAWFEDKDNRRSLVDRFSLEIYRPRLAVVIGSAPDSQSPYEQQKLRSRVADVEVVSYDDIVKHAQRRLMLLSDAVRQP